MAIRAMHTAATGMRAQDFKLDVIANNLANVNTTAFKKQEALFSDLLYQKIREAGTLSGSAGHVPEGIQVGLGTRIAATSRDFAQGSLDETRRPLDIAIQGDGFFRVTLADGREAYTRDGHFTFDPTTTQLVDSNGNPLADGVSIPATATDVSISRQGVVQVATPGSTTLTTVGQIQLVRFQNAAGLRAIGDNLYVVGDEQITGAPTLLTPGSDGAGDLQQGFLETSNVDLVNELVDMIKAQRAFETNSRVISTADEMMQTVSNLRR